MKRLLILGAGTSGTMMANHLNGVLDKNEWEIAIVEESKIHYYQEGYIFIPFDVYTTDEVCRPTAEFIPNGISFINEKIDRILPEENRVLLDSGKALDYDILIIATGARISPEATHGMQGSQWRKSVFDFYTLDGCIAMRDKIRNWEGGRFVVQVADLPIKFSLAPFEFVFLADTHFKELGMRDNVDLVFVTQLESELAEHELYRTFKRLMEEKKIRIISGFDVKYVDNESKKIIDQNRLEIEFDLLATVPVNKGAALIERSGIGDELNYVPTERKTLQSKVRPNIFVIGDASNVHSSKTGSVALFEAEVLTENILRFAGGKQLMDDFEGHANCFVETGDGKALLLDFNFNLKSQVEALPNSGLGTARIRKESRMNHFGKLAYRWIYWNMLLRGSHFPYVSPHFN